MTLFQDFGFNLGSLNENVLIGSHGFVQFVIFFHENFSDINSIFFTKKRISTSVGHLPQNML